MQIQESSLWKLGLNNLFFLPANVSRQVRPFLRGSATAASYGLHPAYEHRLSVPWSVLAEISPCLLDYPLPSVPDAGVALCARAQVAGRYYYNLTPRLRLGKSAGTLAGNYFSVAVGTGFGQ